MRRIVFLVLILLSCKEEEPAGTINLQGISVGTFGLSLTNPSNNVDVPVNKPITIRFNKPLKTSTVANAITIAADAAVPTTLSFSTDLTSVTLTPTEVLINNEQYVIIISDALQGKSGEQFVSQSISFTTEQAALELLSLSFAGEIVEPNTIPTEVPLNAFLELTFSAALKPETINSTTISLVGNQAVDLTLSLTNSNKTVVITPTQNLSGLQKHKLSLGNAITGIDNQTFSGREQVFYTAIDPTPKFPLLTDDELLTKVQQQTFKYFYDYAEPNSGMARERNGSGNTVTTGGTGFGLMAMVVAIERNFITRQQGIDRLNKIVTFLETADRFHGAWSHWVNGSTGKVIPFSTKDNGGDLVETSFLVQGLLTFRQYLVESDTVGNNLIYRISNLYNGVEWDWYRKNNENVLYWHWSPTYNWEMNFAMYDYFEEQITYVLAAASPTHSIPKIVYSNGYGRNGQIQTGTTHYGYTLPLGGLAPLFWTQYSYLGLDPHFSDDYANYWTQNTNASLINNAYCIANPKSYVGYSADCWGLTSSDNQNGYDAHSPANDLGVITPTAALSAFPYTPVESMKALKFFYYTLGDRLWGEYGFYDAFNITEGWTASSYLAIDQGPIIVMIENHRTGLLWDLFMSSPEMQQAINELDLVY
jgi:hypothetical protein